MKTLKQPTPEDFKVGAIFQGAKSGTDFILTKKCAQNKWMSRNLDDGKYGIVFANAPEHYTLVKTGCTS